MLATLPHQTPKPLTVDHRSIIPQGFPVFLTVWPVKNCPFSISGSGIETGYKRGLTQCSPPLKGQSRGFCDV
jgi:hypothetical protein